jgi:hypothetical protein
MTAQNTPANVTDIKAATGKPKRASRASKNAARNAAAPPVATPEQTAAAELRDAAQTASADALLLDTDEARAAAAAAVEAAKPAAITDALTVLLVDGDFEVHKTGCRDIERARNAHKISNEFGLSGDYITGSPDDDTRAITAELWSDIIAEAVAEGTYADDAAAIDAYLANTTIRPCTGIKARARASETTRVLDADAAAARAALLDERAKAAEGAEGKLAIPAGYKLHWAYPAGHSRLARTDAAPEGSPKWLARCDEHGTTKPAAGAKEARSLGSRTNRVSWCSKCKTAAAKKERDASAKSSTTSDASASTSDAPATTDASATIDASDEHDAAVKSDD